MAFKDQLYAITEQIRGNSNRDGSVMTTITMYGLEDFLRYETYVVENFKNARHWQCVTDKPQNGYIIRFHKGRLTKSGQIDADGQPMVQHIEEDLEEFREVIIQQAGPQPKSKKFTAQHIVDNAERIADVFNDIL